MSEKNATSVTYFQAFCFREFEARQKPGRLSEFLGLKGILLNDSENMLYCCSGKGSFNREGSFGPGTIEQRAQFCSLRNVFQPLYCIYQVYKYEMRISYLYLAL